MYLKIENKKISHSLLPPYITLHSFVLFPLKQTSFSHSLAVILSILLPLHYLLQSVTLFFTHFLSPTIFASSFTFLLSNSCLSRDHSLILTLFSLLFPRFPSSFHFYINSLSSFSLYTHFLCLLNFTIFPLFQFLLHRFQLHSPQVLIIYISISIYIVFQF